MFFFLFYLLSSTQFGLVSASDALGENRLAVTESDISAGLTIGSPTVAATVAISSDRRVSGAVVIQDTAPTTLSSQDGLI